MTLSRGVTNDAFRAARTPELYEKRLRLPLEPGFKKSRLEIKALSTKMAGVQQSNVERKREKRDGVSARPASDSIT